MDTRSQLSWSTSSFSLVNGRFGGFLRIGDPRVAIGFNTESLSNLDDLEVPPELENFQIWLVISGYRSFAYEKG